MVDPDGSELICWEYAPTRLNGEWDTRYGFPQRLPAGSIEKLCGRKITWDDSPVAITQYSNGEVDIFNVEEE